MIRHAVTYRQQQPAPTAEGFYYGRWKSEKMPGRSGRVVTEIMPLYVMPDYRRWVVALHQRYILVDHFDWFGPVLECREG